MQRQLIKCGYFLSVAYVIIIVVIFDGNNNLAKLAFY